MYEILYSYMVNFSRYPTVLLDSSNIIIEYADGTREIWGKVNDNHEALKIVEELQTNLRAYEYATQITVEAMNEIENTLRENDCSENLICEVLADFYQFRFGQRKQKQMRTSLEGLGEKSEEQLFDLAVWYRTRETYFKNRREDVENYLKTRLDLQG